MSLWKFCAMVHVWVCVTLNVRCTNGGCMKVVCEGICYMTEYEHAWILNMLVCKCVSESELCAHVFVCKIMCKSEFMRKFVWKCMCESEYVCLPVKELCANACCLYKCVCKFLYENCMWRYIGACTSKSVIECVRESVFQNVSECVFQDECMSHVGSSEASPLNQGFEDIPRVCQKREVATDDFEAETQDPRYFVLEPPLTPRGVPPGRVG